MIWIIIWIMIWRDLRHSPALSRIWRHNIKSSNAVSCRVLVHGVRRGERAEPDGRFWRCYGCAINADPRVNRAHTLFRVSVARAATYKYFWTFIVMRGNAWRTLNCGGVAETASDLGGSRKRPIGGKEYPVWILEYDETLTDEYLDNQSSFYF